MLETPGIPAFLRSSMESDSELAAAKAETYGKVGRNTLLAQYMESLLKRLLPIANIEIPLDVDPSIRMKSCQAAVEGSTLGHLVNRYLNEVHELQNTPTRESPDAQEKAGVTMTTRFAHSTLEALEASQSRLHRIVADRNHLIHHLLNGFDLSAPEGWRSTHEFLDAQSTNLEKEIASLVSILEAQHKMSKLLRDRLDILFDPKQYLPPNAQSGTIPAVARSKW